MASWPPPSELPPPVAPHERDGHERDGHERDGHERDGHEPDGHEVHGGTTIVVDEPGPDVRPGELTGGWSVAFGLGWLAVGVALAAVWTASRQLGLSTWWLGPSAAARPIFVNVVPFVAPLLLVASALNRVRYLPWFGLAGAAAIAVVGIGDLGRVRGFGLVELLIAAAAAAVSLASLAGMYRRDVSR